MFTVKDITTAFENVYIQALLAAILAMLFSLFNLSFYNNTYLPTIFFGVGGFVFTFRITITSTYTDKIPATPINKKNLLVFNECLNDFIKSTFKNGFIAVLLNPIIAIQTGNVFHYSANTTYFYLLSKVLIKFVASATLFWLFIDIFIMLLIVSDKIYLLNKEYIKESYTQK